MVSHPLRMRKALGSNPSVSTVIKSRGGWNRIGCTPSSCSHWGESQAQTDCHGCSLSLSLSLSLLPSCSLQKPSLSLLPNAAWHLSWGGDLMLNVFLEDASCNALGFPSTSCTILLRQGVKSTRKAPHDASEFVAWAWAHGVVVSHPLSMREALGSIPSVSSLPSGVGATLRTFFLS